MEQSGLTSEALAGGRVALAEGRWHEARSCFEEVLTTPAASAEAWEGISWAAWWLEDVPACLEARGRAYRGYRVRGDRRGAARMALWLSDDHLEFHRAAAVAEGWSQRAARLLAELEPVPEHGWLQAFQAHGALARHDPTEAACLAEQARELGSRLGAIDLEMFSLATEGVAMVEQGEVAAGLRCLDEAAAAAVAGEYENLAPAAWTCCLLISTCELVRDYQRGAQWCREVAEFSRRMQARFLTGVCRAHYAGILTWHGSWREAEQELLAATELLHDRPAWLPEALVRLGELRRRQGRLVEAEELFRRVPEHALALLGLAQLSLDRNDPHAARELLERQLRRVPPDNVAGRAGAVELLIRVQLLRGEPGLAAEHLAELRAIALVLPAQSLRAAVRFAEGLLAACYGDHDAACAHFGDAIELFGSAQAPLEAGCCRLELSRALSVLGRIDAAAHEAQAAAHRLAQVGAAELSAQAAAVAGSLRGSRSAGPLTARQLQVLRLVAEGLSDREIAARLVLSEHTVHRHVANIYVRLGCSSRATAVAQAGRRGLL